MKGVPEFWLTIFKNVELLQEMVQDHDEAVLKSLHDITVTFNKDPMVSWYPNFTGCCEKTGFFMIKDHLSFR